MLSRTTLGISVGTRYVAFAVLVGNEVKEWREKAFPGPWSEGKLAKIIKALEVVIDNHLPNALAVKRVHSSRSSPGLNRLMDEILYLADRRALHMLTFTANQLLNLFFHDGEGTRKDLPGAIYELYPALGPLAEKESQIKRSYHLRVFEAVACALALSKEYYHH